MRSRGQGADCYFNVNERPKAINAAEFDSRAKHKSTKGIYGKYDTKSGAVAPVAPNELVAPFATSELNEPNEPIAPRTILVLRPAPLCYSNE